MSSENSNSGALRKLGGQQVGERNRNAARRADGRGLGAGQAQTAAAGHQAQRLRNGGDETEVRAGAHHDDGAAGPQPRGPQRPAGAPTGRFRWAW